LWPRGDGVTEHRSGCGPATVARPLEMTACQALGAGPNRRHRLAGLAYGVLPDAVHGRTRTDTLTRHSGVQLDGLSASAAMIAAPMIMLGGHVELVYPLATVALSDRAPALLSPIHCLSPRPLR
jgi:hypothetical protein